MTTLDRSLALLGATLTALHWALALLGAAGILRRTALGLVGGISHPTTRLGCPRFLRLRCRPALCRLAFDGAARAVFGTDLSGMTCALPGLRGGLFAKATGQTILTAALFSSGDNFAGRTTCSGGIPACRSRCGSSRLSRRSGLLGGLGGTALCAAGCGCDTCSSQACCGRATCEAASSLGCSPRLRLHSVHLAALVLLLGIDLLKVTAEVQVAGDRHDQCQDQRRDHPREVLDYRIRRGQQLRSTTTRRRPRRHRCCRVGNNRGEHGEHQRNLRYRQCEAARVHQSSACDCREDKHQKVWHPRNPGGDRQRETDSCSGDQEKRGSPDRQAP